MSESTCRKYGRGAVCAVYECNNYKQQKDAKSFFRMPKDVERLKKWIVFCKRKDLHELFKDKDSNYFYNTYVICSDHFEVGCFRNKDLLSQGLLPESIPTLPRPRPNVTSEVQKRENLDEVVDDLVEDEASNCELRPEIKKENKEIEAPIPVHPDQQNEIAALKKSLHQYKKKLYNKTSLISKYKKQCKQLKGQLALRKMKDNITASEPRAKNKGCKQFIETQNRLSERHKFGRRYDTYDKKFALALYFCSIKSYTKLQRFFGLPSLSSIRNWLNHLPVFPGLNNTVFELLKIKADKLDCKEKIISLVFGAMSLKDYLNYDAHKDMFEGNEDFGDGYSSLKFCKQAMVIMIKCIYVDFKQVLGYYLGKDALPAHKFKECFYDMLGKLFETGFIIKSIVCDLGAHNEKLRNLLSVPINEPYIIFQGHKIYFLYDPEHVLT